MDPDHIIIAPVGTNALFANPGTMTVDAETLPVDTKLAVEIVPAFEILPEEIFPLTVAFPVNETLLLPAVLTHSLREYHVPALKKKKP
jgi:hypothetical protein